MQENLPWWIGKARIGEKNLLYAVRGPGMRKVEPHMYEIAALYELCTARGPGMRKVKPQLYKASDPSKKQGEKERRGGAENPPKPRPGPPGPGENMMFTGKVPKSGNWEKHNQPNNS